MAQSSALLRDSQNILRDRLFSILSSEGFYSELCFDIARELGAEAFYALTYIKDDESNMMCSLEVDNFSFSGEKRFRMQGIASSLYRNKSSYFSNNLSVDPLSSIARDAYSCELAVPVMIDGEVVSSLHFCSQERMFTKDDISFVEGRISDCDQPLKNLHLYLSALHLNEVLQRKMTKSLAGGVDIISEPSEMPKLIGMSEKWSKCLDVARKISEIDIHVLIEGEIGTGKESLARYIHALGINRGSAFGCFDAQNLRVEDFMKFIEGGRGTLFLKNSHRISKELLSCVLDLVRKEQSGLRVILSMQKGYEINEQIKQVFLYSQKTIGMEVPSLEERPEDIAQLAQSFLNASRPADQHKMLSQEAIEVLRGAKFQGNITELKSLMARVYVLTESEIVEAGNLPQHLCAQEEKIEEEEGLVDIRNMTLQELEKMHIVATLKGCGGNKTKSAKVLGITVKTLYNKLHSYGMIDKN